MQSDYKKKKKNKLLTRRKTHTHTHTSSLSQAPVSGSVDWEAQMTCNLITKVIYLGKLKKKKLKCDLSYQATSQTNYKLHVI